jgi:hypothetical protein
MNDISKKFRLIALAASIATTALIPGCSDDSGLATRYPVSGKVTYKDQPVPNATIIFEPINPPLPQGRVANGVVEKGSYRLTTATPGDGALPGEYKVIILASDLDVSELAKKQGGLLHQGDAEHQKAAKAAKSLLPEKYGQSMNTPLKAKVEARSMTFDFPLTD